MKLYVGFVDDMQYPRVGKNSYLRAYQKETSSTIIAHILPSIKFYVIRSY